MHDNKEGQSLDKYKDRNKNEDVGYVPIPFIAPSLLPQKHLNHSINIGVETKNLNHFVYILKIG